MRDDILRPVLAEDEDLLVLHGGEVPEEILEEVPEAVLRDLARKTAHDETMAELVFFDYDFGLDEGFGVSFGDVAYALYSTKEDAHKAAYLGAKEILMEAGVDGLAGWQEYINEEELSNDLRMYAHDDGWDNPVGFLPPNERPDDVNGTWSIAQRTRAAETAVDLMYQDPVEYASNYPDFDIDGYINLDAYVADNDNLLNLLASFDHEEIKLIDGWLAYRYK